MTLNLSQPAMIRAAELACFGAAALLTVHIIFTALDRREAVNRLTAVPAEQADADAASPGQARRDEHIAAVNARNAFTEVAPKRATFTGVFGDRAIFDHSREVAVGQTINDAKLVEIGPYWVRLDRDGEEERLTLFEDGNNRSAPASSPRGSRTPDARRASTAAPAPRDARPAPSAAGMTLTPEQIQEFRNLPPEVQQQALQQMPPELAQQLRDAP